VWRFLTDARFSMPVSWENPLLAECFAIVVMAIAASNFTIALTLLTTHEA